MPFDNSDAYRQNNSDVLSLDADQRVDEIGDTFVEAWKSGQDPDIHSYLSREADPQVRSELFKHLFGLELDLRLNHARILRLGDYLARFAEHENEVRKVYADIVPPHVKDPAKFTEKYEILELIGEGGQGVVHRAIQLQVGRRLVAFKMIRDGKLLNESGGLRRFRHEIEAVSKMNHPNIVEIYDVGERASQPYFSMKLLEGGDLSRHLENYGNNWKATAQLMATIARAVHHAHQRGVLHRDIKPRNILLDENNKPYIADFGLATAIDEGGRRASQSQMAIVGTFPYMAPEQAQAKRDLTTAVDVYSMGAVLYELLSGRPPFTGDNDLEVIKQVVEVDPPRPSKFRRNVNRDLETICIACMQKDPSKRFYKSAEALANDFDRCLRGEPVKARRISKARRAIKWARRRPGIVSLTAVLILVVVSAICMGLIQWRNTAEALRTSERALYKLNVTLAVGELLKGNLAQADNYLKNGKVGFRNWEWNFLKRWTRGNVAALRQHTGRVNTVIYSPNGKLLASASANGSVLIWDRTGKHKRAVKLFKLKKPFVIEHLAFHPNNDWLACGGSDQTAKIWSLREQKPICSIPAAGSVVAFSPDGRFFAASGRDGRVSIWTTSNLQDPAATVKHGATVLDLSFTSDNKRLVSSGFADPVVGLFVRVWNVETGREEKPFTEPPDFPTTAHASCKLGKLLAVPKGSSVSVVNLDTRSEFHLPGGYNHWCTGMSFSPKNDKTYLLATFRKGNIVIWDVVKRQTVFSAMRGDGVRSVSFNPTDLSEIAYCRDKELVIEQWQRPQEPTVRALQAHSQAVRCLAFNNDGTQLATASDDGSIRIWTTACLQCKTIATGFDGPVASLHFSPDGKYLAAGGKDKTVRLWSLATWKELLIGTHGGAVTSVAFNSNSDLLASGSLDGTARVWNVANRKFMAKFALSSKVFAVAFRPDEPHLAVSGETGGMKVWNVEDKTQIHTLNGHRSKVWCLNYCRARNGLLASGGMDDRVILWDADSGAKKFTDQEFQGHASSVKSVVFNADGHRLASGGLDALIKIWNTNSGEELLTLREHAAAVTALAFCPNGRLLASGDENGIVIIRNGTAFFTKKD